MNEEQATKINLLEKVIITSSDGKTGNHYLYLKASKEKCWQILDINWEKKPVNYSEEQKVINKIFQNLGIPDNSPATLSHRAFNSKADLLVECVKFLDNTYKNNNFYNFLEKKIKDFFYNEYENKVLNDIKKVLQASIARKDLEILDDWLETKEELKNFNKQELSNKYLQQSEVLKHCLENILMHMPSRENLNNNFEKNNFKVYEKKIYKIIENSYRKLIALKKEPTDVNLKKQLELN